MAWQPGKAVLAVALLALAHAPARAELPAAASDVRVEARSNRFVVYSGAGEQAAIHAARHLERLADVLAQTTQGFRADGGREVRVFVFRDLGSFKPYRPSGDHENGITGGFHVSGPDKVNTPAYKHTAVRLERVAKASGAAAR